MEKQFEKISPQTEEEFLEYVRTTLGQLPIHNMEEYEKADEETRTLGYNESAEAMWKVALAGFNYAAHVVGASGFQAGWAALKFYGEAMHIDSPYAVIRGEDMLYPQYDIKAKVAQYLENWLPWAGEEAEKLLAGDLKLVHPDVLARWQSLVKYRASL